ncbi:MAG: methylamine utilization protein [Brevundimonas sp. 12-68-7]|uniref:Methylamine utilization protein n=1 Tax=Brevundimonas subvibrioides TaxID=74313 RepID=A0A258FHU5_9CAUL|nr:MAG: methylamine utilization protein [Brevundimonas sp. 12-68-7]OYX31777.1 MAG: methylamine utilization protein [Brevundimonas subvibrioides]
MRALLVLIFACSAFAGMAHAGDLTVSVRDTGGRPVRDAVVTVRPDSGVPSGPIRFSWPLRVVQQNVQFQPYVLIAPVGGTVAFPNLDRVRHHVYSFSRGNRFEIELFGQDQTRTHTFAATGVAALGCNIHDQMLAYVKVVDTPYAGKTDAAGDVTIAGIPAGAARLMVWHPQLNVRGNESAYVLTIGTGPGRQTMTGDFSARAAVR